jgi:uncharacterized protein with HEPN domain
MDATTFLEDLKTYDAVERCLERINEAAKKLGSVPENSALVFRGLSFVA